MRYLTLLYKMQWLSFHGCFILRRDRRRYFFSENFAKWLNSAVIYGWRFSLHLQHTIPSLALSSRPGGSVLGPGVSYGPRACGTIRHSGSASRKCTMWDYRLDGSGVKKMHRINFRWGPLNTKRRHSHFDNLS